MTTCNQPCVECGTRPCSRGDGPAEVDPGEWLADSAAAPSQGIGGDVVDLIEAAVQEAMHSPDVSWAIIAAKSAAEGMGEKNLEYEARRVGPQVLVTVFAKHLGRTRRNWASARVMWWDGVGTWDDYVKRAMGEVAMQVVEKLDRRSR